MKRIIERFQRGDGYFAVCNVRIKSCWDDFTFTFLRSYFFCSGCIKGAAVGSGHSTPNLGIFCVSHVWFWSSTSLFIHGLISALQKMLALYKSCIILIKNGSDLSIHSFLDPPISMYIHRLSGVVTLLILCMHTVSVINEF